jgi:hypothetical protein
MVKFFFTYLEKMPTKRSLAAFSYPAEEIRAYIINPADEALQKKYGHFNIQGNQLTYRGRMVVPEEKVHTKIKEEYQKSYVGVQKLHSLLASQIYWCESTTGSRLFA